MERRFFFDIGAAVQNLLLATKAESSGSHLIGMIVKFKDKIKEVLHLPSGKSLVIGICLGYLDPNAAIKQYKPKRVDIDEIVT